MMRSDEIRESFLRYFQERGHRVVSSSATIPLRDPTLLFINAGMNQFKEVFLGELQPKEPRAASAQKCIRAGGKHNDLENVGHTSRHLTFFEMLGNFSFGDYFKEQAISFAWDVSVNILNLDPDHIFASVYRKDDEAYDLWKTFLPEKRIVRFGEKENFWAMGDRGPCGPCSELLYDRGPSFGSASHPHDDPEGERFFEFWNLVFMQYNQGEKGISDLPKPSIDTGAGLERLALLKQGVPTVFQTDILAFIIKKIEELSIPYVPEDAKKSAPFHVIADHLRTLSFAIADGAQPSNIERGYVLRKILRRAVRYGKLLGFEEPFLAKIFPALEQKMGGFYPELSVAKERIEEILTQEEHNFHRTLKKGGDLLARIIEQEGQKSGAISGEDAFMLKDTYGLPLDEVLLLAKDEGLTVDLQTFQELEKEAKERSKAARKQASQEIKQSLFQELLDKHGPTRFLGYDTLEACESVLALYQGGAFTDSLQVGEKGLLFTKATPFYAEMGGQVGDTGWIKGESALLEVEDTILLSGGLFAHLVEVKEGSISQNEKVLLQVDESARKQIACHHTATHLLHHALRNVLGEGVRQAGSLVLPDRLRFDFNHHKALSEEEIERIEEEVSEMIRENYPVISKEVPFKEVENDESIIKFFGEKYGSDVRVVQAGPSKELCGGTHVKATGTIGSFKIVKEGSIAQGVRRIEAFSSLYADSYVKHLQNMLKELSQKLRCEPKALKEAIERLQEENKQQKQELKQLKKMKMSALVQELKNKFVIEREIPYLFKELDLPFDELKDLADLLFSSIQRGVFLLASSREGRCLVFARVKPEEVQKGLSAVGLIREISPLIQGGGGGSEASAQAGGKKGDALKEAFEKAKASILS